tara:strand:- start:1130 stop:1429 length:300 start_codon:yes stop_codon:yes gene_type:complete
MNRYQTTRVKLDKSGVRVYGTTYYPDIPIENSDKFVVSRLGDRVDMLAYKYYGDVSLWWIIAKANGIKGKAALEPGVVMRIPGNTQQIVEKFLKLNTSS